MRLASRGASASTPPPWSATARGAQQSAPKASCTAPAARSGARPGGTATSAPTSTPMPSPPTPLNSRRCLRRRLLNSSRPFPPSWSPTVWWRPPGPWLGCPRLRRSKPRCRRHRRRDGPRRCVKEIAEKKHMYLQLLITKVGLVLLFSKVVLRNL